LATEAKPAGEIAEVSQGRELIDGGEFKCDIEGCNNFRTADPVAWRTHCREKGHLIEGEAPCSYCGARVMGKFAYPEEGSPIGAVCDKCFDRVIKPNLELREQTKAAQAQQQPGQPPQEGTGGA
jgi:hypothetical protein